jgi:hypothetical protein
MTLGGFVGGLLISASAMTTSAGFDGTVLMMPPKIKVKFSHFKGKSHASFIRSNSQVNLSGIDADCFFVKTCLRRR